MPHTAGLITKQTVAVPKRKAMVAVRRPATYTAAAASVANSSGPHSPASVNLSTLS